METAFGVAVKVADVLEAAIVTDDGMLITAGDADKAIVAPALGAAGVIATLQVALEDAAREFGVQEKPFKLGCKVTTPFVPLDDKKLPVPSAATDATSCTWAVASTGAATGVRLSVATTPLEIGEVFIPHSKQVATPGELVQEKDLLGYAPVDPADRLAAAKSCVE